MMFQQPDTLIPDPYQPLDWNRYMYARANPLRYNDPSGHKACEEITSTGECIPEGVEVSELPDIPSAPPEGDPATPWEVGTEWLTGEGPRDHEFRDGDPFTELLQKHSYLDTVREKMADRLRKHLYTVYKDRYSLAGIQGVPKYINDYSTLATGGATGNLAVTYLGSYRIEVYIVSLDAENGSAQVAFRVSNSSTLASGIRPPVLGYTDFWQESVTPWINQHASSGPMSQVTQNFWWTETINYYP